MKMLDALEKSLTKSKEYSDKTYSNALKGKMSGVAVSMDDVAQSGGVLVNPRSKNLIPYPYVDTTKTTNGVTFTDNGDGSITINGTATANAVFRLIDGWTDVSERIKLKANSFLSGVPTGASGYYIEAYATDDNGGVFYPADMGNGEVLKAKQTILYAYLIVTSGTTLDNVTVYPQLEVGTTATPYTPYVADDTAVTVKSCGKNLFGFYGEATLYKTTVVFSGSHIDFSATGTEYYNASNSEIGKYTRMYLPKGTYRVEFFNKEENLEDSSWQLMLQLWSEKDTAKMLFEASLKWDNWGEYFTFTLAEGQYISFGLYYSNTTEAKFTLSADFMLINTAIADINEYEPYIEGETIEVTMGSEDINVLSPIAPNMTITTDNDGVVVDVEYNRDINIVIEKLTQAIISLGGNI